MNIEPSNSRRDMLTAAKYPQKSHQKIIPALLVILIASTLWLIFCGREAKLMDISSGANHVHGDSKERIFESTFVIPTQKRPKSSKKSASAKQNVKRPTKQKVAEGKPTTGRRRNRSDAWEQNHRIPWETPPRNLPTRKPANRTAGIPSYSRNSNGRTEGTTAVVTSRKGGKGPRNLDSAGNAMTARSQVRPGASPAPRNTV